jgi:hypothetical protein
VTRKRTKLKAAIPSADADAGAGTGLKALVLGLAALYAAWLLWGLCKPLRNDDILWSYTGMAIVQRGVPSVHYAVDKVHLGFWHPPLFQYECALFFRALGWSELAARLPGLLGVALTALIGWGFLRWLGQGARAWVLALGLLVGVPLTQAVLVPDIDGSLLAPILLGLLWALSWAAAGRSWTRWAAVAGLAALAMLCKWTTPPVLFGLWALFILLHKDWRRVALPFLLSLAVGCLLAAALYLGFCAWMHLSPLYPVEFSFLNKASSSLEGLQLKKRCLSLLYGTGLALGPGLLALFAGLWVERRQGQGRHDALLHLLLVSGLSLLLAYSFLFPGFSPMSLTYKYLAPASAFFAVALALRWDGSLPWLSPARVGAVLVLALSAPWLYNASISLHHENGNRLATGWIAAGLLALGFLRWRGLDWAAALRRAGLGLACFQAAFFYSQGLWASVDAPPSFPTRERGYAELVRHPPEGLKGRVVLADKDLLFYLSPERGIPASPWFQAPHSWAVPLASRPLAQRFAAKWPAPVDDWAYYPAFELAYSKDPFGLRSWLDGPVEAVVDSDFSSFLEEPGLRELVEQRFPRHLRVGDYSIYIR